MRLASTVLASLILHALLLLISSSPCFFHQTQKSETRLSPTTLQEKTTGLLVTLRSPTSNNQSPSSLAPVASEVMALQPVTERIVPEKPESEQASSERRSNGNGLDQPSPETDTHYYSRNEVDRPSRMIDDINEQGGPLDKALREVEDHGSVILELWINDRGWIDKTEIISSTLPKSVVAIIRNNIELARSIPARLNDQNVHSKIRIEFEVREKPNRRE